MFITKEEINKIKEYIDNLYWDEDRMSSDGRYFLNGLDNYIKKLERVKDNNIYVITNNAIMDHEVDYSIYGVATNINEAKKIFNKAIEDAKCDFDFDNINPVEENSDNYKDKETKWVYTKNDDSFELWEDYNYNANNISIQLKKYDLNCEIEKEQNMEI